MEDCVYGNMHYICVLLDLFYVSLRWSQSLSSAFESDSYWNRCWWLGWPHVFGQLSLRPMQKWQPCLPRWPTALGLSGILQSALSAWGLIIGSWCLSMTHSRTVWLLSRACKFTSLVAKAYNASGQAASTSLSRNLLDCSQQWKSRWRLLKTLCLGAGQGPPLKQQPLPACCRGWTPAKAAQALQNPGAQWLSRGKETLPAHPQATKNPLKA